MREAQEAAQDAAIKASEAEARAAEDAEAAEWMGLISTEEEGAAETELAEENQVRLIAFFRFLPCACLLAAEHHHCP